MRFMKTALVHDWLTGFGGGEKVLEALHDLFPSPIYTLVKNNKKLKNTYFEDKEVYTSFLQSFPFAERQHRYYLPFFPLAIEQFDLRDKELILSCSHAVAKGVLTHAMQLHICYCFTPMRYAWDLQSVYTDGLSFIKKWTVKRVLHSLRKWDVTSSPRVDVFVAISQHVAKRIQKIYRREASVIYPPVQTQDFQISSSREDYYITCSRLVPYKRVDLIIEAFKRMPDKKLLVIGDGPEKKKISSASTKNIEILGALPQAQLSDYLSKAKAFIFAAEEDFGISVVEAQACGVPVLAYGKGGALETVKPNETGLFFSEQTPEAIREAVNCFEKKQSNFDPLSIKAHAERFSTARFKKEFASFVNEEMRNFYENHHPGRREGHSSLAYF
jgi:glycosyltransferase involved in cell wall biosynthesis